MLFVDTDCPELVTSETYLLSCNRINSIDLGVGRKPHAKVDLLIIWEIKSFVAKLFSLILTDNYLQYMIKYKIFSLIMTI